MFFLLVETEVLQIKQTYESKDFINLYNFKAFKLAYLKEAHGRTRAQIEKNINDYIKKCEKRV